MRKPREYWKDIENVKREVGRVMRENELDIFPTHDGLTKLNEFGLAQAISRYYGFPNFRERLRQEKIGVDDVRWQDLDFATEQAGRFIKENGFKELPSPRRLKNLGARGLSQAITHYHGGPQKFRRMLYVSLGINNPIKTESELEDFLNENEGAKKISSLITVTENIVDVAQYLSKLWPDRFPSAADLVRSLPSAVKKIGYSLQPFTMEKARGFYQHTQTLDIATKGALDDLLYKIAVEQYQIKFNLNPEDTMEELKGFSKEKNGISSLAKKVLDYYNSVYEFSIPGYGKLRGSA